MLSAIDVILPIFLVIGFGYLAVYTGLFSDDNVDALMTFAQNFAIPCLLFRAISTIDLGAQFQAPLLISFHTGALAGFIAGLLGARYLFHRPWEDSVAIGFVGLFSNSLVLGVSITERAFGPEALAANFAIVAIHAPFCYTVGVTAMEVVRLRGARLIDLPRRIVVEMSHNALVIGIVLGFAVNLLNIPISPKILDAVDLMAIAAIPAALFGMGGVLCRYRPEGDMRTIVFICAVSLILHPLVVWGMGRAFGLDQAAFRSAVVTAAVAPGVNTYIFANLYGVARRVAASAVLFGTIASIFTVWIWLLLLA